MISILVPLDRVPDLLGGTHGGGAFLHDHLRSIEVLRNHSRNQLDLRQTCRPVIALRSAYVYKYHIALRSRPPRPADTKAAWRQVLPEQLFHSVFVEGDFPPRLIRAAFSRSSSVPQLQASPAPQSQRRR